MTDKQDSSIENTQQSLDQEQEATSSSGTVTQREDAQDQGRRAFFRAAAAGAVAGTAAFAFTNEAEAQTRPVKEALATKDYKLKLSALQARLSKEDLAKDVKLKMAEQILQDLDNVEIQWVKGSIPGTRRVIQIKG